MRPPVARTCGCGSKTARDSAAASTAQTAGSASDVAELFALNDSGTKPKGSLARGQDDGKWYNPSSLENDSGINLLHTSYRQVDENTIIADEYKTVGGSEARVRTLYTRNPDGTITTQHLSIQYFKDDAPGGGGGGGGGREYTIHDDGTVSYTQDGHTYRADDDVADDVKEAARTGDASGLSSVDQVTVSDGSGDVVATNFTTTPSDAENLTLEQVRDVQVGSVITEAQAAAWGQPRPGRSDCHESRPGWHHLEQLRTRPCGASSGGVALSPKHRQQLGATPTWPVGLSPESIRMALSGP